MSESQEQAAVVRWFRLQYPTETIIAIPNGAVLAGDARQRAIAVKRMKAEGMQPGVSDLFIAAPRQGLAGMWLEMKATGKTQCSLSKEQKAFLVWMQAAGYAADWAAGAEQAIDKIKAYMANNR
jgi:hypothetical protein